VSPRPLLPSVCAGAALALAAVRAESAPTYDWLRRYEVPAGCPTEPAFRHALAERVGWPLADAFARLRLEVEIRRSAGGSSWQGRSSVKDESDTTTTRSVAGASCEAVVEALSLIAALSVGSAPPPEPPSPEAPLGSAEPAADAGAAQPARGTQDGLRLGPVAWLLLDTAVAPQAAMGLGAGVSLHWQREGSWSPELQVGVLQLHSEQPPAAPALGSRFEVTAVHANLCPLELLSSNTWSVRPCLEVEGGRISGTGVGSSLLRRTERRGPWLSSGVSLRAAAAVWGPLSLAASAGATLPWVRHEFFVEPDRLIFRVPSLGWRATGSLAATF
jgi:hypothetical protein